MKLKLIFLIWLILIPSVLFAGNSNVDETKPTAGQATTQSVRDNFAAIKAEIEAHGWYEINETDFTTAITAIGATKATLIVSSDTDLSGNTTIPNNVTISFKNQAHINLGNYNLTFNGHIEGNPMTQIFHYTGTGVVNFGDGAIESANPAWWGMLPSASSTTNANAILVAIASLGSGASVKIPLGTYNVDPFSITSYSRIKLEGSGQRDGTELVFNTSDKAIQIGQLTMGPPWAGLNEIKNMKIKSSVDGNGTAIYLGAGSYNTTLENLWISRFGTGIYDDGFALFMKRIFFEFQDYGYHAASGAGAGSCVSMEHCWLESNDENTNTGIGIEAAHTQMDIYATQFNSMKQAIKVVGSTALSLFGCYLEIRHPGLENGTAESGGSNTLTDSDKSWTTNQFAQYLIKILSGTGAEQVRLITSNTSDTLTVSPDWATIPGADSVYRIMSWEIEVTDKRANIFIVGSRLEGWLDSSQDEVTAGGSRYVLQNNVFTPWYGGVAFNDLRLSRWYLLNNRKFDGTQALTKDSFLRNDTYRFIDATLDTKEVIKKTTDYTITEGESGKTFSNEGAPSGTLTFTLPPATSGLFYTFVRNDSDSILRVDVSETNIFRYGNASSTAGDYLELLANPSTINIICTTSGAWEIHYYTGALKFETYGMIGISLFDGTSYWAKIRALNLSSNITLTVPSTSGTLIHTETDPQVGTLTNGKWCSTDGTDIDCTQDAPSGAGDVTDVFNCASGDCSNLTAGTSDILDMSGATSGYSTPCIHATDCSAVIAEGRCCWETDADHLWIGDGAAAKQIDGGGSGLFEIDINGDLQPIVEANTDEYFELDVNDDIMPKI